MSKLVAVRLPEETLKNVDRERKKNRLTRAAVIKQALDYWVERRQHAEKVRREHDGYEKLPLDDDEFGALLAAQKWPK